MTFYYYSKYQYLIRLFVALIILISYLVFYMDVAHCMPPEPTNENVEEQVLSNIDRYKILEDDSRLAVLYKTCKNKFFKGLSKIKLALNKVESEQDRKHRLESENYMRFIQQARDARVLDRMRRRREMYRKR
jgi:hypothetical protein